MARKMHRNGCFIHDDAALNPQTGQAIPDLPAIFRSASPNAAGTPRAVFWYRCQTSLDFRNARRLGVCESKIELGIGLGKLDCVFLLGGRGGGRGAMGAN